MKGLKSPFPVHDNTTEVVIELDEDTDIEWQRQEWIGTDQMLGYFKRPLDHYERFEWLLYVGAGREEEFLAQRRVGDLTALRGGKLI